MPSFRSRPVLKGTGIEPAQEGRISKQKAKRQKLYREGSSQPNLIYR